MQSKLKTSWKTHGVSFWTFMTPALVWIVFGIGEFILWTPFYLLAFVALVIGVIKAVHHAEIVAEKIGEPCGALVLALAVTMIEVSIIVSLMLEETVDSSVLARDTVFAAMMMILTGMVGLVVLIGGLKYKNQ